jgi:hypothetical protein
MNIKIIIKAIAIILKKLIIAKLNIKFHQKHLLSQHSHQTLTQAEFNLVKDLRPDTQWFEI